MNTLAYVAIAKMATRIRSERARAESTNYHAALGKVAESLTENVARLDALCLLPSILLQTATQWQACEDLAMFNLTGSLVPEQRPNGEVQQTEQIRLWKQLDNPTEYRLVPVKNGVQVDEPAEIISANNLDFLIDNAKFPFVKLAGHALLSAILLAAHTVFDSVAVDLWIAAVNARPRTLAQNALEFSHSSRANETTSSKAGGGTLPLSLLAEYNFDVSKFMGDLLKARKRVNFESFSSVQRSYMAAFRTPGDKQKRPSNGMTNLFSKYQADLHTLDSLRNLLSHRGGRVDQKFLDEVRPHSQVLSSTKVGVQLPLDGETVARLAEAAVRCSDDLIALVNNWLSQHKDSLI